MSEQSYLDALRKVLNEGDLRPERTGIGTRSLFGMQMRFDIRYHFPLLTSKKMNLASISSELLWFIEGSGDERRLAEIRWGKTRSELTGKKTIWTANLEADYWKNKAEFEGDLGKIYGQMWRKFPIADGKIGLVQKRKTLEEQPFVPSTEHLGKSEFDPVVCQVGCLGRITPEMRSRAYYKRAFDMWKSMLGRCYDKDHPSFKMYGANGANVSPEWKCFEFFINTIHEVPYFHEWAKDESRLELDKDYFGSNSYSKETCIFVTPQEYGSPLIDNKQRLYCSIFDAARKTGFPSSTIIAQVEKYKMFDAGEIKLTPYRAPNGFVVRELKVIDQLANLIEGIKTDPYGRRHILTAWNPGEMDQMALPPCHIMSQFYVSQGELSCQLYQRSADFFLGVPFNIASYSMLTMMIAQVCGLKAGDFIYSIGDAHIYNNHVDVVEEQLSRSPLNSPLLYIDPDVKEIDDFGMHNFQLIGYDSHGPLKAEMAV